MNWPMQPRRRPCVRSVTNAPCGWETSGSCVGGISARTPRTELSTAWRAMPSSAFLAVSDSMSVPSG